MEQVPETVLFKAAVKMTIKADEQLLKDVIDLLAGGLTSEQYLSLPEDVQQLAARIHQEVAHEQPQGG